MFPSRKELATSNAWYARAARALRNAVRDFTLPAPRLIVRPALLAFLVIRSAWHFVRRVFFAEPLFKAYCTRYGRRVRTDIYLPWVQGSGDLIVGDDVLIDGAIGISFAARFVERPTFEIGSHSGIGHGCKFVVAKRITIGNHCRLAQGITMRDSSGHPSDPEARRAGLPPSGDDIKPITVCDDSWIGAGAFIFPGVTLGRGCVVSAQAVVMSDVAPYTIVAGNPARRIGTLSPPADEPSVAV